LQVPKTRMMQENVYDTDVMFFSPEDDQQRENVSIKINTLSKAYTLDEYLSLNQS